MWLSIDTASWIYDLANIGLIIGLVLGVICTVLAVWIGNVKEDYLNRALVDSRERTATLEKQSAESKLAIAKDNQGTGNKDRLGNEDYKRDYEIS